MAFFFASLGLLFIRRSGNKNNKRKKGMGREALALRALFTYDKRRLG
jgi:hypothetical protein